MSTNYVHQERALTHGFIGQQMGHCRLYLLLKAGRDSSCFEDGHGEMRQVTTWPTC